MDYGLLIGIIGTVATIIFGFIGIIIPLRKSSQKSIEFVEEENINLYNSVVKNISDLSLSFQSTPIKENIHLLRGFLVNVGEQDITSEMVEKKLKIHLAENSKWLSAKIINKSNDLVADLKFENNNLEFETGLFRHQEFIYFEAIAESPSNKLRNELKIEHRIANAKNITYKSILDYTFFKKTANLIFPFLITTTFFFLFSPNNLSTLDLEVVENKRVQSQFDKNIFKADSLSTKDSLYLNIKNQLDQMQNSLLNERNKFRNKILNHSSEFKLMAKAAADYSFLQLLIEGNTKIYEYGNGGKMQFRLSSKLNLYIIIGTLIIAIMFFITLINDLITYQKLKPMIETFNNAILNRKKNTDANED